MFTKAIKILCMLEQWPLTFDFSGNLAHLLN